MGQQGGYVLWGEGDGVALLVYQALMARTCSRTRAGFEAGLVRLEATRSAADRRMHAGGVVREGGAKEAELGIDSGASDRLGHAESRRKRRRVRRARSRTRRPGGPRLPTRKENQILKFTRAGKFLLQVGHRGMSKGSLDTANFNNAADIYVYQKTNEAFVADGYVNRRVIVLDADTGEFKRMWGAYGNRPDDTARNELKMPDQGRSSSIWFTACGCRTTGWWTSPTG